MQRAVRREKENKEYAATKVAGTSSVEGIEKY
jgi:hypothetical protein